MVVQSLDASWPALPQLQCAALQPEVEMQAASVRVYVGGATGQLLLPMLARCPASLAGAADAAGAAAAASPGGCPEPLSLHGAAGPWLFAWPIWKIYHFPSASLIA
jgi:hypothetical protein